MAILLFASFTAASQCNFTPSLDVMSNYEVLSGDTDLNVSAFEDYYVCGSSAITYSGTGFHDFWLEEGATLQHYGTGTGTIFAIANSLVEIHGESSVNIYITAGSEVTVHGGEHNIYIECGGTLLLNPGAGDCNIFAECGEDDVIVPLDNPSNVFSCSSVGLNYPGIPGVFVDLGGPYYVDCTGTTATLDASSVPGPYVWSTGETSSSITVSEPGIYTVTVPSNCEFAVGSALVELDPSLPQANLDNPTSYCGEAYPITLAVDAGFDSYSWSTGETGASIEVDAPGVYSVSATNACGTQVDELVISAFPDEPATDFDFDTEACDFEWPITLEFGNFAEYNWSSGETSAGISVTEQGIYSLTATGICGSQTIDFDVTSELELPTVDLGINQSLCEADFPITLDAGEQNSFLWDGGETTQTLEVTESGVYGITVSNVCGSAYDSVNIISLGDVPDVDLGEDFAACSEAFPLGLNAGSYSSYVWDSGENSAVLSVDAPGNYGVQVTNACGTDYDQIAITDNGSLPVLDLGEDLSICEETFPVQMNAGLADSYAWQDNSTGQYFSATSAGEYVVTTTNQCGSVTDELTISSLGSAPDLNLGPDFALCSEALPFTLTSAEFESYLWNGGETTESITVSDFGDFGLTVTNVCGTDYDDISVVDNGSIPAVDLGTDMDVCEETFPLLLDAGTASTFEWQDGTEGNQLEITSAGTYSVTASNQCGSASDEIVVNSLGSAPTVNLGEDMGLCEEVFPIELNVGDYPTIVWESGETSENLTINTAGNYGVTVSNVCGTATDAIEISSLGAAPTADLGPDQDYCDELFPIELNGGVSESYFWGDGEETPSLEVNGAGTYSLSLSNVCGSSSDEIVIGSSGSTPVLELGEWMEVCEEEFPLELDAGIWDTYAWDGGESQQMLTVNTAGQFGVMVSNACGNTYDEIEIISLGSAPTIDLGADISLCEADFPAQLDAGNWQTVEWSTAQNTAQIEANQAGIYSVTVTNVCGSDTDEIEVISLGTPPEADLGEDLTVCEDAFPIALSAGLAETYLWDSGEESATLEIMGGGNYAVELTNQCGTSSASLNVATIAQTPPLNLGEDLSPCPADLPVVLDAGLYASYAWNTGNAAAEQEINESGWYGLTASDDCGSTSDSVFVAVVELLAALNLGEDLEICSGDFPLVMTNNSEAELMWSTGDSGNQTIISQPGTVTLTASTACESITASVNVYLLPDPEQPNLGDDLELCQSAFPYIIQSDALANDSEWSTGETGQSIAVEGAGIYTLTSSNVCGTTSDDIVISTLPNESEEVLLTYCLGGYLEYEGVVYDEVAQLENVDVGAAQNGCDVVQQVFISPLVNEPLDESYLVPFGQSIVVYDTEISEPGYYIFESVAPNGCPQDVIVNFEQGTRPDIAVFIPSAFTPDNDGVNDVFGPVFSDLETSPIDTFSFEIFDRWGQRVYFSNNPLDAQWMGENNSSNSHYAQGGLYQWRMKYTQVFNQNVVFEQGYVTMLR